MTQPAPATAPLLAVEDVAVAYDGMRALQGVSLRASAGTIVALVGANGAGKTSLLRAISGIVRPERGTIVFDGSDITRLPAHDIVRRGIAHVPEGRRVFASATVHDNLLLGAYIERDRSARARRLDAAFAAFPILRARLDHCHSERLRSDQDPQFLREGSDVGGRIIAWPPIDHQVGILALNRQLSTHTHRRHFAESRSPQFLRRLQ